MAINIKRVLSAANSVDTQPDPPTKREQRASENIVAEKQFQINLSNSTAEKRAEMIKMKQVSEDAFLAHRTEVKGKEQPWERMPNTFRLNPNTGDFEYDLNPLQATEQEISANEKITKWGGYQDDNKAKAKAEEREKAAIEAHKDFVKKRGLQEVIRVKPTATNTDGSPLSAAAVKSIEEWRDKKKY